MHKLRTLHLFAGAGGGILADILLGHQPVGAVEIEPYCRQVLHQRQQDGALPWFPIFDDVTTFEGGMYRGLVDVIAGGFPCQDISAAGKGEGITGKRSGLWGEMARIVGEVQPRYVFVENSPLLVRRGLAVVLGDLAALGYDARWCVLGARDAGAPHRRDRIWLLAVEHSHSNRAGRETRGSEHQGSNDHSGIRGKVSEAGRYVADAEGRNAGEQGERQGRKGTGGGSGNSGGTAQARNVRHPDRHGEPTQPVDAKAPGVPGDVAHAAVQGLQRCTREGMPGERGTSEQPACAGEAVADAHGPGLAQRESEPDHYGPQQPAVERTGRDGEQANGWWSTEPDVGRVADELAPELDLHGSAAVGGVDRVAKGVPNRVSRLKAIGNGQVPQCAAMAWRILGGPMTEKAPG